MSKLKKNYENIYLYSLPRIISIMECAVVIREKRSCKSVSGSYSREAVK